MVTSERQEAQIKFNRSDLLNKRAVYCLLVAWVIMQTVGLILGYIWVRNILTRIEETQKGNACILLIRPEKRTPGNTTECVDKNRKKSKDKDFEFNTPSDSQKSSKAIPSSLRDPMGPLIEPPKTPEEPEPSVDIPGVDEPEIEFRVGPINGKNEWRYVTDTVWSLCDGKICDE